MFSKSCWFFIHIMQSHQPIVSESVSVNCWLYLWNRQHNVNHKFITTTIGQLKQELNVSSSCTTCEWLVCNSQMTHVQLMSLCYLAAELYHSKQLIAYYCKLLPDLGDEPILQNYIIIVLCNYNAQWW